MRKSTPPIPPRLASGSNCIRATKAALLYKYIFEKKDSDKYEQRLNQTPLDNHCESTIHTYSSFIWKTPPQRDLSKLAQTIRNTNHSTLVKNDKDSAVGGAGGVIVMDYDTEKKPYLLQPQLFQLEGLLKTIEKKEDMINTMTHLRPVRQVRTHPASGVAIQTEFQLLNTLLAEKAAGLQITEYRLLRIFCKWVNKDPDKLRVIISYPQKFELHDRESDLRVIEQAKRLKVKSEVYQKELKHCQLFQDGTARQDGCADHP